MDSMRDIMVMNRVEGSALMSSNNSLLKYHPLTLSSDIVGSRNYLNYDSDFGDLEEIALSANLPRPIDIDPSTFVNGSTPTLAKISKLRGDAAEYLASVDATSSNNYENRPSSTHKPKSRRMSGWSDSAGGMPNTDGSGSGSTHKGFGPGNKNNRYDASTKKTRVARLI